MNREILLIFLIVMILQKNCRCKSDELQPINETNYDTHNRNKRYSVYTFNFMPSNHLTYRIESYSKKLNDSIVDEIIAKAFKAWTDHSGLVIKEKRSGKVDIEIGFYSRDHGDNFDFDGEGGKLGHAFFPPSGLLHFDDDEMWVVNTTDRFQVGVNLLPVAVHEIGHILGLQHVTDNSSIMYEYYSGNNYDQLISTYDVNSIQKLYGPPEILTEFKPPYYDQTLKEYSIQREICNISIIDGIVSDKGNNTNFIVFSNNKYFVIEKNGLKSSALRKVSDKWPEVEGKIISTFIESEALYLFTKRKVWRYTNKVLDIGYPKRVNNYYPGGPKKIDAITWDRESENILIFNKKNYWRITINPFKIIKTGRIPSLNVTIIAADIDREGNYRLFGKRYFYQMRKFEDL